MDWVKLEEQVESLNKSQRLIIRDDVHEFNELQGVLELASRKKLKPIILDTGLFGLNELTILSRFHFSFYSGDLARPDFQQLTAMAETLKKKNCPLYFFLEDGSQAEVFDSKLASELEAVFVSSRQKSWETSQLAGLAEETLAGGTTLVYYHHGQPEESLAEWPKKNCWLHLSNRFFDENSQPVILELLKKMKKTKSHLIIHLDMPASFDYINSLSEGGAHLIFNFGPIETRSRLSRLESSWNKKKLPEKVFYLYQDFMA
ncbi:MAG: hypothetical protein PHU81_02930 [Acidobacteriota bacterium]|nr:hypothetical protein [Acidobacteriota bacterium]